MTCMRCAASFIVVLLACALAVARRRRTATPAADDDDTREANTSSAAARFPERIKMAPGADFTVQLIDDQLADTPAAVIASDTYEDVAGPPYDFALAYDPAKVRPGGRYGLSAQLRGADGALLFTTDTRVPVTPGAADARGSPPGARARRRRSRACRPPASNVRNGPATA